MVRAISFLRHSIFEADPYQADLQVDFEKREADPSKMTISQNLHPPEEETDGSGAPYDGVPMDGMPGGEGGLPQQPPSDEEMTQIQPGMQQPEQTPPPMQESYMGDYVDIFLDDLLEGIDDLTEAPYPDWVQRGNAPQEYAGFGGPQQAPPSVAAGGPAAIANWQRQMAAVGGGQGGDNSRPGGSRPGSRQKGVASPAAAGPAGGPVGAKVVPASAGGSPDSATGFTKMGSDTAANLGALRGMALGANRGVPDFRIGRAAQLEPGVGGAGRAARILGGNAGAADAVGGAGGAGRAARILGGSAGAEPPPGPTRPGVAGVGRAGQIRAGNAGPVANAAAGAGEGGVMGGLRNAGNWAANNLGGAANKVARFAGRALPVVAGGIAGAEDYGQTGNLGHAATVGGTTAAGTAAGAGLGATIGGAAGALGGPAAPVTVPLGAMLGGAAGGYFGGKGGEAIGRGAADTMFGTGNAGNKAAAPAGSAQAGPAPAAQRAQAQAQTNQPPPASNTRFYQQNPQMKPPAAPTPTAAAQAAPQSTGSTAAAATPGSNLVSGLSKPTGQMNDWTMNWTDHIVLLETDQKKRGY